MGNRKTCDRLTRKGGKRTARAPPPPHHASLTNLQVMLSLAASPTIIALGVHQAVVSGGIDLSVGGSGGAVIIISAFLAFDCSKVSMIK